jgi:predicted ATP-dependent protease
VKNQQKVLPLVIVSVLVIGFVGYTAYYYYAQNQQQAGVIADQSDQILQKSLKISQLEGEVRNKSTLIAEKNDQIQNLFDSLDNLGIELEFAQEEISKLSPEVRNYYVVGVRNDDKGVVVPIEVKIVKGAGAVSVNINNVDLLPGAQGSIRIAANVAASYAGETISDKDITVSFAYADNGIVTVDGGSAGAAIATTIIGALTDRHPSSEVLITGTISPDGKVGQIGSQTAKAVAARDFGASTFLVPAGQFVSVSGINVVEVGDIDDVVERVLNVN